MLEMKTPVTEVENAFDRLLSRLGMAKGRSLGQRIYQYNPQKLKNKVRLEKNQQNIEGLWYNYNRCNIYIIGIPKQKEGREELFETLKTEDFPKLMSDIKLHIWEAHRTPNKLKAKQKHPYTQAYHFQLQKIENKIPERGKKHLTYRRTKIRIISDFSTETIQIREWHACCHFSHVQLLATPWTVACQAPLSIGFSRQEYWSGLPCPLNPGIESVSFTSPALAGGFFTTTATQWSKYFKC